MEIVKTKTEGLTVADRLAIAVATAVGAGFAPKAPGTAGSLVGVLLYLSIEGLGAGAYYPHAIILLLVVGIWASSRVEHLYGHDSQHIVIDEVVGQMITFAPAAGAVIATDGGVVSVFATVTDTSFDGLPTLPAASSSLSLSRCASA